MLECEVFKVFNHGLKVREHFFGRVLVAIVGETRDVAEQYSHVVVPARLDGIVCLEFLNGSMGQDDVKEFIRTLFFGLNVAEVHHLAVAKPFLFQACVNACSQQDWIAGLGKIILCAQLNTADDTINLL